MIDTLKAMDSLRKAGFAEEQARAIAGIQREAMEEGGLATKSDIARLEARMDAMEKSANWKLGMLFALIVPMFIKIFLG